MRVVNGLEESTCFCFRPLLEFEFCGFVLRNSKSMEGWLSWLKAPDSKSGARFVRAAGSNPAPSANFSFRESQRSVARESALFSHCYNLKNRE